MGTYELNQQEKTSSYRNNQAQQFFMFGTE